MTTFDHDDHSAHAWLFLAAGDDRQHAGNRGYDDQPDTHYSWDSTVPNHANPHVGDRIALWDKRVLLGMSVIDRIDSTSGLKTLNRCPSGGSASMKERKRSKPRFRCSRCASEFEMPAMVERAVTVYRSSHEAGFTDLRGELDASTLRDCCHSPKSQLSLRPLNWARFLAELGNRSATRLTNTSHAAAVAGGHRRSTCRVRIGQAAFRGELLRAFGYECAFTGPAPPQALEAAHLYSYARHETHDTHGALLLRRDIHRLFDEGLLAIDPANLTIDLSPELGVYPVYEGLQGARPHVEFSKRQRVWLALHWEQHRE